MDSPIDVHPILPHLADWEKRISKGLTPAAENGAPETPRFLFQIHFRAGSSGAHCGSNARFDSL
jgi:hypothetical protein